MDIVFKKEHLKDIKKDLDLKFALFKKEMQTSQQFRYAMFRIINELFIVKVCIDNGLIPKFDYTHFNIDDIKTKLANNNNIFKTIFEHGEKYLYKLTNEIELDLRNIIFRYSYNNIDIDFIGKLYQFYIKADDKKKYGQFYTDEAIIDEILDDIGIDESNDKLLNSRYLDPACGTGSFIVRIVNRIIAVGIKRKIPANVISEAISRIYGFDVMNFAIYIAQSNMLVQMIPVIAIDKNIKIKFNLFVTNSIENLTPEEVSTDIDIVMQIKQRRGVFKNGFDFIIGNPPYFKVKSLNKSQKNYFNEILSGQQNMYGLFLYLIIKLLKRGGKLGVIVPESLKSGQYFRALREYIFYNCIITNLVTFDCRKTNFVNALQGVLIICAIKGKINSNIPYKIEIKNVTNKDYLLKKKFNNKNIAEYKDVVRYIKNYPILLVCKKAEEYNLFNATYKDCNYLSDCEVGYKAQTGKLVWNQVKKYLVNESKENTKLIIWSNNIEQYKYSPTGDKNRKNKYGLFEDKLKKLICFEECILLKRISIKEQSNRINACYFMGEEYFLENHVNFIKKVNELSTVSYNYILALLNSDLINFIMSQINGNNQISVTELNLLPIKRSDRYEELEELVENINSGAGYTGEIKDRLNRIIFEVYCPEMQYIQL